MAAFIVGYSVTVVHLVASLFLAAKIIIIAHKAHSKLQVDVIYSYQPNW